MTEVLYLIIGLLLGIILMYVYMKRKGVEMTTLYTDSLLKNQLLKQELKKSPKKNKNWKGHRKYHGKKQTK